MPENEYDVTVDFGSISVTVSAKDESEAEDKAIQEILHDSSIYFDLDKSVGFVQQIDADGKCI